MRFACLVLAPAMAAALALAAAASARAPAAAARPAVDYADPAAWLCRPGRASDACGRADLDAVAFDAEGARTPKPFHRAVDPPVDCFYVYPTVSAQPSDYSDLGAGREEAGVAASQFARFASVCRTYAPLYRQLTLAGLGRAMRAADPRPDWTPAYQDVRAAWRSYLAHDNRGRGVVLIGHSQGAILLQRLLAEEIDTKPAQARLVSAFLAGDPGLEISPQGGAGATLKAIPTCAAKGATGCVYAWASYAADDAGAGRIFGHDPGAGVLAACVNPAAPGGGAAPLDSYLRKPAEAPSGDPPWVEVVGGYTGACTGDAQGHVLRVSVAPGRYASLRERLLAAVSRPGWGLHPLDVGLVQGDMLDEVGAQGRAWAAAHR